MSDIADKIRKLTWMVQEVHAGTFNYDDICDTLSDLTEANVSIIDNDGAILGSSLKIEGGPYLQIDPETGERVLNQEFSEWLASQSRTSANIWAEHVGTAKDGSKVEGLRFSVIPILGGGRRWGTFAMSRKGDEFSNEDLALGEYGATMVGLMMYYRGMEEEKVAAREMSEVRMAIGTLSYSETEAVKNVFEELEGTEGALVASRIADRSGITRSVIVNALRKLESAGVIETRSMGMKGTRIKILNSKFKEELEKIN